MKNTILITSIIISLLLCSCQSKMSDPLNGFEIGSSESIWKANVDRLIENKLLTPTNNENEFDSYLIIELDTINTISIFNYDEYFYGSLLEYRINLNGDIDYFWGKYYDEKGAGYQSFETIRLIYDMFIDFYGKPLRSQIVSKYPISDDEGNYITDPIYYDTPIAPKDGFISYWEKDNYVIEFHCGDISTDYDSIQRVDDSYVSFRHINYDNELKKLKDSILNSYIPNDYANFTISSPTINIIRPYPDIYDRSVKYLIKYVQRGAELDERDVLSIKFDLIIEDSFHEPLMRMEDQVFSFTQSFLPGKTIMYDIRGDGLEYSFKYYSGRQETRTLERARLSGEELIVKFDLKAVRFSDGSVLTTE